MGKQRLAVYARHTKNARTKQRAKNSPRNHQCVAGPLHLTIWWWASSFLRFSRPVEGFFSSRSTDMLQPSHRPQKMMPCGGTSLWPLCTSRFPSTKRFTRCASDNPFWMSWLPLGLVRFFALVQRVFLGKRVSFVTCQQCETRRGFPLPFWEGFGSATRRTLENAAFAPQSLEHVLRKVKQLEQPDRSFLSCFPVDLGTWREEHALRLSCAPCQSCYDDAPPNLPMSSHELPGSHSRVLGARPHCELAVPRCHKSTNAMSTARVTDFLPKQVSFSCALCLNLPPHPS